MATPTASLPAAPSTSKVPLEDPMVGDVLNEMEQEVHRASTPPMPPMPQQLPPMLPPSAAMSMYASPPSLSQETTQWWSTERAKHVVVAMLLSLMLFYPNGIFPGIYNRFKVLQPLEQYDFLVRVFLLGALFYVLLTYVPL